MSDQQPSGLDYLCSFPGRLNIIETIVNVAVLAILSYVGLSARGAFVFGTIITCLVCTAVFVCLHIKGLRQSRLPWHWIECITMLLLAMGLVITSSVAISALTTGYIIAGIVGYISAMVYFIDTFDKYQLAVTPTPKYAWTMPNMPDLS